MPFFDNYCGLIVPLFLIILVELATANNAVPISANTASHIVAIPNAPNKSIVDSLATTWHKDASEIGKKMKIASYNN